MILENEQNTDNFNKVFRVTRHSIGHNVLREGKIMSENQDNRSVMLGEKALGYIKYNKSDATPKDYELWYNYAAGLKPEMNQEVKQLYELEPQIPQNKLDKLYDDFFQKHEAADRVGEISAEVSEELSDIMEMVGSSLANTESYSESLEVFTSELNQIHDEGSLKMMIASMANATFKMAENTRNLETNLHKSQKHIQDLNESIESIRNEALTDALTCIANRKKFDITMDAEILSARAEGDPMCLLLTDIDHFKKFNDTHGHQTGDQVLRLVAAILSQNVKGRDLAARYGGEEFAIILPKTALANAFEVAEQIRKAVAKKELIKKSTGEVIGRVTLSLGVAELNSKDTIKSIIARADECLYAAKGAGRNNVKTEAALTKKGNNAEDNPETIGNAA